MILLKELYLNLRDQSQQVATTEQPTAAEKNHKAQRKAVGSGQSQVFSPVTTALHFWAETWCQNMQLTSLKNWKLTSFSGGFL